ncbi:hypothetical protein GCM10023094_36730 [Rhodococcus olei]|uniref:Transglutaminase superfamily protein n=1 Tax=Rhodococcus olei TaxID=2161675 RepID=A0ABP8PCT5_9NOCA
MGLCYAKSHLLAALLRIGGIPTALCYQWLVDDDYFMLHGLVAVHLDGAWHRLDARGNKEGVDARFDLGVERLAWPVRPEPGERDFPTLHVFPPRQLVRALRSVDDIRSLTTSGPGILPDRESSHPQRRPSARERNPTAHHPAPTPLCCGSSSR